MASASANRSRMSTIGSGSSEGRRCGSQSQSWWLATSTATTREAPRRSISKAQKPLAVPMSNSGAPGQVVGDPHTPDQPAQVIHALGDDPWRQVDRVVPALEPRIVGVGDGVYVGETGAGRCRHDLVTTAASLCPSAAIARSGAPYRRTILSSSSATVTVAPRGTCPRAAPGRAGPRSGLAAPAQRARPIVEAVARPGRPLLGLGVTTRKRRSFAPISAPDVDLWRPSDWKSNGIWDPPGVSAGWR